MLTFIVYKVYLITDKSGHCAELEHNNSNNNNNNNNSNNNNNF